MEEIQEINTLRVYSKVLKNRISIELPGTFDAQEVELIIIPRMDKPSRVRKATRDGWKADFLDVSQWDIYEDSHVPTLRMGTLEQIDKGVSS